MFSNIGIINYRPQRLNSLLLQIFHLYCPCLAFSELVSYLTTTAGVIMSTLTDNNRLTCWCGVN